MIRLVAIQIGLFLLPFLAWAAWNAMLGRTPPEGALRRRAPALAFVGLVLVIVAFVVLAVFDGGSASGVYVPDRFENGRLVPGRIE
ncbi:MAG: DUF6111 family protein [Hyphomicrobiales bacterium]|nr:DUF6111 family protein [Hyphomicrobiales bacterium]